MIACFDKCHIAGLIGFPGTGVRHQRLKESGAKTLRIICMLATMSAIEKIRAHHPDVAIYTAAIDEGITDDGYILPGLGDVGERMFGTR